MRIVFGVMAIFIAVNIVLPIQQRLMGHLSASPLTHRLMAALVGYLSSLIGLGGGAMSVPTLHALGADMHRAVGTGAHGERRVGDVEIRHHPVVVVAAEGDDAGLVKAVVADVAAAVKAAG